MQYTSLFCFPNTEIMYKMKEIKLLCVTFHAMAPG